MIRGVGLSPHEKLKRVFYGRRKSKQQTERLPTRDPGNTGFRVDAALNHMILQRQPEAINASRITPNQNLIMPDAFIIMKQAGGAIDHSRIVLYQACLVKHATLLHPAQSISLVALNY